MISLSYLIPISLLLGVAGLAAFLWSLKSGQCEDPALRNASCLMTIARCGATTTRAIRPDNRWSEDPSGIAFTQRRPRLALVR